MSTTAIIATITYPRLVDSQDVGGSWTGEPEEAIAAGVEELGATQIDSGDYIYRASGEEGGGWYVVDVSDVAEMGAAALNGHASAAHSLWCAGCGRDATPAEIYEVIGADLVADVARAVGRDDSDDIGVIVRQAIADGITDAQEIADIVREARAEAKAERDLEAAAR